MAALDLLTWSNVKSLIIFFGPILLPRILGAYRVLRTSIASRPPPRPVPQGAERALNFLFLVVCLFIFFSLPFQPYAPERDVFHLTKSRLHTSTDVIFNRLARLRPDETLTDADRLLKESFTSVTARKIYLAFGPTALTSCEFCSLNSLHTYLVFYLPVHVLLPHLVHVFVLFITTSKPITGPECSRWRGKFTLAALALAAIDLYIVATNDALNGASVLEKAGRAGSVGYGFYYVSTLVRFFTFGIFDLICAGIIYLSSTNRFFFKPPSNAETLDQGVSAALKMLTGAKAKLHAANTTRNAVVRDKSLKQRDDTYWQDVVATEEWARTGGGNAGPGASTGSVANNIWEEPEVVQAMSRTLAGQGDVDLAQLAMNAQEFVRGVTSGLDQ